MNIPKNIEAFQVTVPLSTRQMLCHHPEGQIQRSYCYPVVIYTCWVCKKELWEKDVA